MGKLTCGLLLLSLGACGTKAPAPTPVKGNGGEVQCGDIEPLLQTAYSVDQPNAALIADNVGMMMRECAAAPQRVVACVKSHSVAVEITQQCTAPVDDNGTEGQTLFGGGK
jgi:hypothetical protein